jgi:hypothetical protein
LFGKPSLRGCSRVWLWEKLLLPVVIQFAAGKLFLARISFWGKGFLQRFLPTFTDSVKRNAV